MHDELADAIRDTIDRNDEGLMVSKYVLISEVITADGKRAVVPRYSDGMPIWDAIGLVESIGSELRGVFSGMSYENLFEDD